MKEKQKLLTSPRSQVVVEFEIFFSVLTAVNKFVS